MSEANSTGQQTAAMAGGDAAAGEGGTTELTVEAGREDLTVFFGIGIVVDVVMVTAFLVWAVRQWRKARK